MKFNQPMIIKNAQKHVKEIKKCQENIKIFNIFEELLYNGVLPCQ